MLITSWYSVLSKRLLKFENFQSLDATIIQYISDFPKILKNWREKLQLQIIWDYSERLLLIIFSYSLLSKQLLKWENFNMDQDSLVATIIQYISDFQKFSKIGQKSCNCELFWIIQRDYCLSHSHTQFWQSNFINGKILIGTKTV